MKRATGTYRVTSFGEEKVKSFIPNPLPPKDPAFLFEGKVAALHEKALTALARLEVAGAMVPSADWFLYGFVRKEAVISSQIEGTQATMEDIVAFEATHETASPADVEEVCNYIDALKFARQELERPKGLPLCTRLLCAVHQRLMQGTRGSEKQPGQIRRSQNWIGGNRPGTARFVPPPPDVVPQALADLERWIHSRDSLSPLVKAGLAHMQFETIHPFLDGNGRIGRLLISLLVEHWGLLSSPLLYLSLSFKRHQREYYEQLNQVRIKGDWEGWIGFFLGCVCEAADDGVLAAKHIFALIGEDRQRVVNHEATTVTAIRLFDLLPEHPMVTLPGTLKLLSTTKPTAGKAIDALIQAGVLRETTGKRRDRVYVYRRYLDVIAADTKTEERASAPSGE